MITQAPVLHAAILYFNKKNIIDIKSVIGASDLISIPVALSIFSPFTQSFKPRNKINKGDIQGFFQLGRGVVLNMDFKDSGLSLIQRVIAHC